MSTTEAANIKAVIRRLHDTLNAALSTGSPELISKAIDEFIAPDVELDTPLPVEATGAEVFKEVFATLSRAFPDLHVAIEELIVEGDKVVSRNTVTGTHQGEYLGIAPTGRSISYREIFIFRVEDGRIVRGSGVVDVLSQLRQLGAIPPLNTASDGR